VALSTSFACLLLTLDGNSANSGSADSGIRALLSATGVQEMFYTQGGTPKMLGGILAGLGTAVSDLLSVVGALVGGLL
jgi:hypothetical protein